MTVTINLGPEKEKRLKELADRAGVGVEEYINSLISGSIPSVELPEPRNDWERAVLDFPKRHPVVSRHLSNEDLRRENIYEDRA